MQNFWKLLLINPSKAKDELEVSYRKKVLVYRILFFLLIISTSILIPTGITLYNEQQYLLLGVDILLYVIGVFIYFSKSINFRIKQLFLVLILGVLGTVVFILMGFEGPGFLFLSGFGALASLFYGFRGLRWFVGFSVILLVIIEILTHFHLGISLPFNSQNHLNFAILFFNFLGVSLLINLSIVYINKEYERTLKAKSSFINALEKKTEDLIYSNKQLDHVVYTISHDVRGPITNILGLLSIMEADGQNAEEYLIKIKESAKSLDNYTKEVVRFFSEKNPEENFSEFNLNHEVEEAAKENNPQIVIDFDLSVLIDENTKVYSSRAVWRLLLNTLFSNAKKFRSPNRVLKVKLTFKETPKSYQLWFKDNGIGIPPQKVDTIFEIFTRGNNIKSEGVGLSLYLVNEALKRIGGEINVSSKLDEFTSFFISVPKTKAPFTK